MQDHVVTGSQFWKFMWNSPLSTNKLTTRKLGETISFFHQQLMKTGDHDNDQTVFVSMRAVCGDDKRLDETIHQTTLW